MVPTGARLDHHLQQLGKTSTPLKRLRAIQGRHSIAVEYLVHV